jgi:hypothetical protein
VIDGIARVKRDPRCSVTLPLFCLKVEASPAVVSPALSPTSPHICLWPTSAIMSEPLDIKAHDVQNEKGFAHVDDSHNLDVHAKIEAFKAAAMAAEVEEQKSGVLQAVREYPMAATWAFVMSCTIVSHDHNDRYAELQLMSCSDHGSLLRLHHG